MKSITPMSGFYVIYKACFLEDRENEHGLTHFIEHLMCRRFRYLEERFAHFAIDFNAITSDDYVVFYMAGIDKYIRPLREEFLTLLLDHRPLDEKDIEEERPVILQEYSNHFSDAYNAMIGNGLRKYYDYYGPMGLKSDIENADYQTLNSLYDRRFTRPYMIINISKDSPFEPTAIQFKTDPSSHGLSLSFKGNTNAQTETVYPNEILLIGRKNPLPNEDLSLSQMLHYLLCGDLHKPLMQRLRVQLGLTYGCSISDYVIDKDHLVFFSTEVAKKNRAKVIDEVSRILANVDKYVTEEMFSMAVDHFKIKREMCMIGRHNNIMDLFYPNLLREGSLESLTYESVIEHAQRHYSNVFEDFIEY